MGIALDWESRRWDLNSFVIPDCSVTGQFSCCLIASCLPLNEGLDSINFTFSSGKSGVNPIMSQRRCCLSVGDGGSGLDQRG